MPPRKSPPRASKPVPALAIDLGFCSIEVAFLDRERPAAIPLRGSAILQALAAAGAGLPAVVHGTPGGDLLVGEAAEAQLVNKPRSTVAGVVRLLGLQHEALAGCRPAIWSGLSFAAAQDGSVEVTLEGRAFGAVDLVAALLRRAKEGAEAHLGHEVDAATMAVPAGMPAAARAALVGAANAAGLRVLGVVEAPAAILRAWAAVRTDGAPRERVAVVRVGGGSFDVTVASVGADGIEVLAQRSEPAQGGADLDSGIAGWVADRALATSGVDLRAEPASMRRLARVGEEVKIALSTRESGEMNLPFLSMGPKGPVNVAEVVTRATLEELASELVERVVAHARAVLGDPRLEGRPVDHVLLVGGMTRMPHLRRAIEAAFGRSPEEGFEDVGAIARGSALLGADPSAVRL